MDEKEIDSIYYERPYYLEPGKGADKAYVLLKEAMEQAKKVALATFAFRNKEDLVALRTHKDVMILQQLRFQDQIREYDDLEIPDSAEVTRREIEMAVKLVEQQEGKFTPSKFKDTYIAALKKLINAKAKGKKVEPTKSSDLIEQLKASLERSGASA